MSVQKADNIKAAIQCNDVQTAIGLIDEFLASGFNVDSPLPYNPKGFENNWSLIFWASLCQTDEILRCIVEKHRGNVNVRDSSGYTPLLLCAFHGKFQCVKYLVEHGADINARSNFGESLEELVLRKPQTSDKDLELREYVQKLIRNT
ncbi:unnamed protein product [Blepharisma stoltei]|uniref:Ankyrin repeat domain-containing protein n=1 Tax=Blepharisma stoltei TaxID=1481888 RepID=A0AAU9IRF1_9CILI|nr:unnamed protein product [Blepharisma stoltei]